MTQDGASPRLVRRPVRTWIPFVVAVEALIGFSATVVWAAAGAGYFWAGWVWLGCALSLAPLWWMARWNSTAPDKDRPFRVHGAVSLTVAVTLLIVWFVTGRESHWLVWPLLGLGSLWVLHAFVVLGNLVPLGRDAELNERLQTLSRTRLGALDAQAAELRRIERDLHDGAQARLVFLSMQLGRAEGRLQDRPEAAELIRSAREEAGRAIVELRDLVRGIAPPVLADRGLAAAVRSLAQRAADSVVEVSIEDVPERLAPAIENAAYFVIAEALTNVAKHAAGASARVQIRQRRGHVIIDVSDDGPGGADTDGRGLQGLRARVAALDGTLTLMSPPGGPTRVHVEVPCGS